MKLEKKLTSFSSRFTLSIISYIRMLILVMPLKVRGLKTFNLLDFKVVTTIIVSLLVILIKKKSKNIPSATYFHFWLFSLYYR